MFSSVLVLFILFVAATSTFPYPPFSRNHHHSRMENILESSDLQSRKVLQSNEIVGCEMEDFMNVIGLEELQDLVEALAGRKGVSPFLVLRKLYRRMRNKEEMEEALVNAIDGPPIPEMLHNPFVKLPPAINMHSETNHAPYSLAPDLAMTADDDDTKVVIIPVVTSPLNRTQAMIKPEHKLRKEISFAAHNVRPLVGKLNNMLPGIFVKNDQLKPPLGATVRVNSGDPLSPLNRDIIVTVSPLMSLTEALRQAEIKFQNTFGLSHDTDIITFAHSSAVNCYIVNSVDDVSRNEDSGWKLTIMERDGQVVYDSFCLPNSKEVLVKPGSMISLTYVPL